MLELPSVKMKKRANMVIMIGTLIFALAVAANLFKIMVIESEEYQKDADNNQFGAVSIPANRGSIYSADGKILAQSATVFRICLDPSTFAKHDTKNREKIIDCLVSNLDVTAEEINEALEKTKLQYVVISRKVEMPQKDKIQEFKTENDIRCIMIEPDTKRYYPQDYLAASVIGFTNSDGAGQYGVEAQYDEYLAGVDGVAISAQDAQGDQMPYKYSKLYEAQDGNSVYLTIDTMIQYYTEAALNSTVERFNAAESGCAIVMDVNSGAILGMATAGGFDLNNRTELPEDVQNEIEKLPASEQAIAESAALEKMWKNKAVSTAYEPGSVFKAFTGSAAVEENLIHEDTSFECPGYKMVDGEKIDCWCVSKGGHYTKVNRLESLSFDQALAVSCNPAFMTIGLELGAKRFVNYLDAFGLTEKTGIDLPSEVSSVVSDIGTLEDENTTLARSAFGQNNIFTPIEMITGFAAVVNGGYLLKPYVVSKVVDSHQNSVLKNERTVRRQVISEETSAIMRDALRNVVESNPDTNVYIDGYRIGGKSGTSEKVDKYRREKNEYYEKLDKNPTAVIPAPVQQNIASYCCFAPADNPEVICLVMVDEPDQSIGYYGSEVAMPCAAEIMKNILPYMGVLREYNENEKELRNITVPDVEYLSVEDAQKAVKSAGFIPEIRGEGTSVTKQIPSFTTSMPHGGKVILYTTADCEVTTKNVPDVTDMTYDQVAETFAELGLNLKVSGSVGSTAGAVKQSVAPGSVVNEGTVIEVQFGTKNRTG